MEREQIDAFAKEEKRAAGKPDEELERMLKRFEVEKEVLMRELAVAKTYAAQATQAAKLAAANPHGVVFENGKYTYKGGSVGMSALPLQPVSSSALAPVGVAPTAPASALAPSPPASAEKKDKEPRDPVPPQLLPVVAKLVSEGGSANIKSLVDKVHEALVGPALKHVRYLAV